MVQNLVEKKKQDQCPSNHITVPSGATIYGPWQPSVSFTISDNPLENIAYIKDTVVSKDGKIYKATADITFTNNMVFEPARWTEVVGNKTSNDPETFFADDYEASIDHLIPKLIPGTATSQ